MREDKRGIWDGMGSAQQIQLARCEDAIFKGQQVS